MTALLLALFLQDPAPEPLMLQDLQSLQKRKMELQVSRVEVRHLLQEARDRGDAAEVRKQEERLLELDREIEALSKKIDELDRGGPGSWIRSMRLGGEALLTHWDDDLELEDAFGWGARLHLPDPLYFDYRRWEPRDELGSARSSVQAYEIGLNFSSNRSKESPLTTTLATGFGWIHFDSPAPGSDSDTGWIWTTRFRVEWEFTDRARLGVGTDIDLARTDFNQDHTHTTHSFSLSASLHVKF
jgi:hypothetical protein